MRATENANRGVGEDGKPLSSYWKAKLLAEEREERVRQLEEELQKAHHKIESLERTLQGARISHSQEVRSLRQDQEGRSAEEVSSLREQLDVRKRNFDKLQKKYVDSEKVKKKLLREVKKRDKENEELRSQIQCLMEREAAVGGSSGGLPEQTVRGLLRWFRVPLREGVLLRGRSSLTSTFLIRLRSDGVLERVEELIGGEERVYFTVKPSEPPRNLFKMLLPCKKVSRLDSDGGFIEALKLMGATFQVDNFF